MATTTAILYCVLSMFFGSCCMSAMGFGCTITYLFIYQIGAWSGLEECCGLPTLKYQVLLSVLGLFSISPLLMFKTQLSRNISWPLYVVLVPVSMVMGPVGQLLQKYTPVPILRIIVGISTLFVAVWQLIGIYLSMKPAPKVGDTVFSNAVADKEGGEEREVELVTSPPVTNPPVMVDPDTPDLEKGGSWRESVSQCCTGLKHDLFPPSIKILCMLLAGVVGGLMGGLVGAGGPPIILFFFLFDYPREVVRANGAAIAVCNSLVLLVSYLTSPPPAEQGTLAWFVVEDVWLYVGVVVAGWVGCPVGIYLNSFLNKWGYKVGLCALLILNGVSMIATAGVAMSNS